MSTLTGEDGRTARSRADARLVLTTYLVVLMAVPAVLVVAALGTAGSPSTVLSLCGFGWWGWHHLHRHLRVPPAPHRVRLALVAVLLATLAAYANAMSQPMPADELTPADSGLLRIVGLCGIALVACDGLLTLAQYRAVVRRLVLVVAAAATLGIVQQITGELWVDRISVPGLSGTVVGDLGQRAGLARPSATSTHPIEFGVVLSTTLPLAVVTAQRAARHRWLYLLAFLAISIAIMMTISRSAIVCSAVGITVLASQWSMWGRLKLVFVAGLLFSVVYVTSPGVLGTIGNLFVGASEDASVESRTDSYSVAWAFIERNPVLGRGPGTFLPQYWILDNQYLGLMIEIGIVGCAAVVLLFLVAARSAGRAARAARSDADRDFARGLQAAVLAGAFGFAFFDTLAFPQSAGVLMLVAGLCGAARRLQPDEPEQRAEVDAHRPSTTPAAQEATWSR